MIPPIDKIDVSRDRQLDQVVDTNGVRSTISIAEDERIAIDDRAANLVLEVGLTRIYDLDTARKYANIILARIARVEDNRRRRLLTEPKSA